MVYKLTGTSAVVCSAIVASPHEYSEVMLGMAPETYCKRMRQPATWGGAIELAILAQHFATELIAVDVGSGVVHTFGEGQGFEERAWLVYSGMCLSARCAARALR